MAYSWRVRVHVCVYVRVPSVHVSKEEVPGRHSLDTLLQQRCDGWMEHDTVGPEVGYMYTHAFCVNFGARQPRVHHSAE